MAVVTSTATCTAFRAVEQATGELVPTRLLTERVGFLAALIQAMSTSVVAARWNEADLVTIGSGVGPDGRALPAKGWMALRRLGWHATPPEGVYVSDRVLRAAEEAAARALRLAVHRHQLLRAILGAWPDDPRQRTDAEWAALRQRLPQGSSKAEVRNRTRQVRAWQADHAGRLPGCLTVLEAVPQTRGVVLLAAADKQLVTLERVGPDTAVLRVQLPLTERPASRAQWAWALGTTVIYIEDLAMLAARGRRPGNARLSGQVRGTVAAAIRHLASKHGIATVTVPARGTSRLCPRCGKALHHAPAPDRIRERGWKWASCPSCGLAGDRDHAAAERIVARGLLAQARVRTEPKSGQHTITTTVEGNVARARRPKRRTRAARQADRAQVTGPVVLDPPGIDRSAHSRPTTKPALRSSRCVPDRRAVPAPAAQPAGKRPAGQAPQTRPHRQARAGSGPARDWLICPGRLKRPDTGWGFHRNVTATIVLPMGDYGPATAWPRLPERLNHSGKPQQSETLPEDLS